MIAGFPLSIALGRVLPPATTAPDAAGDFAVAFDVPIELPHAPTGDFAGAEGQVAARDPLADLLTDQRDARPEAVDLPFWAYSQPLPVMPPMPPPPGRTREVAVQVEEAAPLAVEDADRLPAAYVGAEPAAAVEVAHQTVAQTVLSGAKIHEDPSGYENQTVEFVTDSPPPTPALAVPDPIPVRSAPKQPPSQVAPQTMQPIPATESDVAPVDRPAVALTGPAPWPADAIATVFPDEVMFTQNVVLVRPAVRTSDLPKDVPSKEQPAEPVTHGEPVQDMSIETVLLPDQDPLAQDEATGTDKGFAAIDQHKDPDTPPMPTAGVAATHPTPLPVRDTPVPPASVAPVLHHMQVTLAEAVTGLDDQIELTLSPDDLGPLRFDMRREGDSLTVVLSAERPETLDLMRRHLPDLLAELKQAGYQGGTFSFGQWSGKGHDPSANRFAAIGQADTPPSSALPAPATMARTNRSGRGLDMRL